MTRRRKGRDAEKDRQIQEAIAPALALIGSEPIDSAAQTYLYLAELLFIYDARAQALDLIDRAQTCQLAFRVSRYREPPIRQYREFESLLVRLLARVGNTAEAYEHALALQSGSNGSGDQDRSLCDVVAARAWLGDIAGAKRGLPFLKDPIARLDALSDIAVAGTRVGRTREAAWALRSMRDKRFVGPTRELMACWLAWRGNYRAAVAIARAIPKRTDRARLFAKLAECAAAENEPPLPVHTSAIPIKRYPIKHHVILYLAAAERLAKGTRYVAWLLMDIAISAARAGCTDSARDLQAKTGNTIIPGRDHALNELALAEARAGAWIEADRTIRTIRAVKARATTRCALARLQAGAGESDSALATANAIRLGAYRSAALLEISRALREQGKRSDARALARSAYVLARHEQKSKKKPEPWLAQLFDALAAEQATQGHFCDAARTAFAKTPERVYMHTIFETTALAFAHAGDFRAALLFAKRAPTISARALLEAEIALLRLNKDMPADPRTRRRERPR